MVLGRWIRSRPGLAALTAAGIGFVLFNALAFHQARAMLRYAEAGSRTPPPEALSPASKLRVMFAGVTLPRPENDATPGSRGLAFATHSVPMPHGEHLELWHIPASRAPRGTVILFHGYGCAKESLLDEAAILHGWDWECVLVDFRGSGGSSGSMATLGMKEAEDVAVAVRAARAWQCSQPTMLYGRSMGAAAVLRAVHAGTVEPDGLILEAVFDTLMGTIRQRFDSMRWPAFPAAHALLFWGSVQSGTWAFRHNPATYARAARGPALVLHGAKDPRAPLAQGLAVYSQLAGPKTFVRFDEAGHDSCLLADPGTWTSAVSRFLSDSVPAVPTGSTLRDNPTDTSHPQQD